MSAPPSRERYTWRIPAASSSWESTSPPRVHDGVCPNVYEFWWTRNGARKYGPGRAVALALPAPIASATARQIATSEFPRAS